MSHIDTEVSPLLIGNPSKLRDIRYSDTADAFVWDGALALNKAMTQLFGYAHRERTKGFFGSTPPRMISIETGYNETESVPWGSFSLPGIDGKLVTGYEEKDGIIIFNFTAEVKKKHSAQIRELGDLTRKFVREESVYRGKAFSIRWYEDNGDLISLPQPKLLNLTDVKESEIIFSKEVERDITTSLFTPIEKSQACRD
ncbi:MAG: hypothetical protein IID16_11765, partial [Candidatus Marinimicrobia bacterium]|nr:hypothetical protein [Candidatus Neomarinimicrobiota bacterium]